MEADLRTVLQVMIRSSFEYSSGGPFDITKAVDLTDEEIAKTWVDLPNEGFEGLVNPRAPMPQLILGGKGSGRTHLMRYYSYELQKLRAGSKGPASQIASDRYVGVFMRCEGLNAGRFAGKGQGSEVWDDVFAYYLDLWLAELVILTLRDAFAASGELLSADYAIAQSIAELFDEGTARDAVACLADVLEILRRYRRSVDSAVNNAVFTRDLTGIRICASRGRLVFGVPQAFAAQLPSLGNVQIDYLIDEFENLAERQQVYVNTLIRERQRPSTFKVGARLYGIRTKKTLSAGEANRLGSEFEQIVLDDQLRARGSDYKVFAERLVRRRLEVAGYKVPDDDKRTSSYLRKQFEEFEQSRLGISETTFVEGCASDDRPYMVKLRRQLTAAIGGSSTGVVSENAVSQIMNAIKCEQYPLIEKTNTFLLYQAWARGKSLVKAAQEVRHSCDGFISSQGGQLHRKVLKHFRGDLLAQLLRDFRQAQRYLGFDDFVSMSSAIPRHLLIVLKFVYRWALFYGEEPFAGRPISAAAQRSGVQEAANWFFEDARTVGDDSHAVQTSIDRLARFLMNLRFSDKPVESSLSSFSVSFDEASERAKSTIMAAANVSLLVRIIGGQKDRNAGGVVEKYQVNPMVCPRFDLPLARRGVTPLSAAEVEAIFGDASIDEFNRVLESRLSRMLAPFLDGTSRRRDKKVAGQAGLPGL
jgi:hypothetical protein